LAIGMGNLPSFDCLASDRETVLKLLYHPPHHTDPAADMSNTVHNDTANHRFTLDVDGHIAFTQYRLSPGVITFVHTEVPKELGGRGIGSALARGALEQVRALGLKVVARCPFIAGFIAKNPEFNDLLQQPPA